MYSKYFWKTLKLQAIIHRKDKKRLIFSPLHIYSSIYIGAKICIITCIFSIYLCPVKKVFSIKDDTHRGKTLEIQGFHDLAIFADFSENRLF